MISILIVDDHHLVGEGTKEMLEGEEKFCVHYVASALEVLDMDTIYDLYIVDIHMPDLSGIELAKKLLKRNNDLKIILYTGLHNQKSLSLFTQVGISGVISKTATKSELITLINTVLSGYTFVPLSIFKHKKQKRTNTYTLGLTEKDLTILKYVSDGLSNKEIAKKLFLADRSVEYHLSKIYKNLNVKKREEAVVEAFRLNLLDLNEEGDEQK
ncbi:response regulator [Pseudogracilibacillus auburnensis]|uniref:LuxR family two component transcriptional regulator n=1 Tax=Pseudogracilibacillus auburnensis TaxID=1494959 RepID=A0A2V3VTP8_9BACI|nr:response regulator transcription factor [Pseudogracilibacillus auburnensis]PXW85257.1 LuxR family two component transcriptional regulator [Pseudogracilibacillus auburnensis]